MAEGEQERELGRLVEEWHALIARGAVPDVEEFRRRAGPHFEGFLSLLGAEAAEDARGKGHPEEILPRTFGEYTLLSRIGSGAMGVVYRAVHRRLARIVALKVLSVGLDRGAAWGRFQRGARAAAQVDDEHVVRIFDCDVFEGRPYVAMSYVPGVTLQEVLRRLAEIPEVPFGPAHHARLSAFHVPGDSGGTRAYGRRVAALLLGPARALAAYHADGIVHRDVKPDNVMVDETGRVVLLDFDLVRTEDTQFETAVGTIVGTPAYSSPEQLRPDLGEASARSDVYALGAVLFHAITLRAPHATRDLRELIGQVTEGEAPDPARWVRDLPEELRRIVRKALERRPEDRYPSMAALVADLEAFVGGGAVSARPVSLLRRIRRRAGRTVLGLGGLAALALAAAFALPRGEGVLLVTVEPRGAKVLVDDRHVDAPQGTLRLEGGPHRLRATLVGFREALRDLVAPRGGTEHVLVRLEPVDPSDPSVLEAWCRHAGIEFPTRDPPAVRGAPARALVRPLLPRGRVRPEDLARVQVALGDLVPASLELLDAQGRPVARIPVEGDVGVWDAPMPPAFREALRAGGTWSLVATALGTRSARAEFEVVPAAPARVWPADLDAPARALLEAADLLALGLPQAALARAREVEASRFLRPAARLEWAALERLGLDDSALAETTQDRAAAARSASPGEGPR